MRVTVILRVDEGSSDHKVLHSVHREPCPEEPQLLEWAANKELRFIEEHLESDVVSEAGNDPVGYLREWFGQTFELYNGVEVEEWHGLA